MVRRTASLLSVAVLSLAAFLGHTEARETQATNTTAVQEQELRPEQKMTDEIFLQLIKKLDANYTVSTLKNNQGQVTGNRYRVVTPHNGLNFTIDFDVMGEYIWIQTSLVNNLPLSSLNADQLRQLLSFQRKIGPSFLVPYENNNSLVLMRSILRNCTVGQFSNACRDFAEDLDITKAFWGAFVNAN